MFGQGTAGDIWRSMLSEQVSLQIAKSGELGLAGACSPRTSWRRAGRRIPRSSRGPPATRSQISANVLSAPAGADIDSGAILIAARRRT